jgi:hypothetical protein
LAISASTSSNPKRFTTAPPSNAILVPWCLGGNKKN